MNTCASSCLIDSVFSWLEAVLIAVAATDRRKKARGLRAFED